MEFLGGDINIFSNFVWVENQTLKRMRSDGSVGRGMIVIVIHIRFDNERSDQETSGSR